MQSLAITWLGHSSFRLRTPGGKEVLLDPWLTGNPSFPESARPKTADLILISHGHFDHFTDAEALARTTGATVVAIWEITTYLGARGIKAVEPMNKGGTITTKGLRITMTDARHSSSFDDNGIVYLGEAAGFVVRLENGQTIYFAADGRIRWGRDRQDGPAGERNSPSNPNRPMGNRNAAALIGKIGEDMFFIGDETGPVRMRSGGRLYLGVNDDVLTDNSGNFRVVVYY